MRYNKFYWLYFAFVMVATYLFIVYGGRPGLGPSASEHGEEIDFLYDANWIILLIVFYLTQTLLFVFAIKYHQKKGRKAAPKIKIVPLSLFMIISMTGSWHPKNPCLTKHYVIEMTTF